MERIHLSETDWLNPRPFCDLATSFTLVTKAKVAALWKLFSGLPVVVPNGGCCQADTGIGAASTNGMPVGAHRALWNSSFAILPMSLTWNGCRVVRSGEGCNHFIEL